MNKERTEDIRKDSQSLDARMIDYRQSPKNKQQQQQHSIQKDTT